MATEFYKHKLSLEDSCSVDRLHLADALFFSGEVGDAGRIYCELVDELEDDIVLPEAALKLGLCKWLAEIASADCVPAKRSEAFKPTFGEASISDHQRIITSVDALNELAHFNIGVALSKDRKHAQAFPHFLLCAMKRSGDDEAWANAIICTTHMDEGSLLISTITVAMSLRGRAAYERLRDQLFEQDAPPELLSALDEIVRQVGQSIEDQQDRRFTFRLLPERHFDRTEEIVVG
ncbi:MAG: hypothetical protein ABIO43_11380 [Sphingomicrobium sp.]